MLEHTLHWVILHIAQWLVHVPLAPNDWPPPPCGVSTACG